MGWRVAVGTAPSSRPPWLARFLAAPGRPFSPTRSPPARPQKPRRESLGNGNGGGRAGPLPPRLQRRGRRDQPPDHTTALTAAARRAPRGAPDPGPGTHRDPGLLPPVRQRASHSIHQRPCLSRRRRGPSRPPTLGTQVRPSHRIRGRGCPNHLGRLGATMVRRKPAPPPREPPAPTHPTSAASTRGGPPAVPAGYACAEKEPELVNRGGKPIRTPEQQAARRVAKQQRKAKAAPSGQMTHASSGHAIKKRRESERALERGRNSP